MKAAFFVVGSWILVAATSTCGADEAAQRNLICIVTDDQATWTLGAYGNREVRTPHLDRLAAAGARFANAFTATPVCSPSRVALLTGLYGTQVGITDYLNREEEAAGLGLPATAVTWPSLLQRHGYATELIGKWHLGTQPEFHPTRRGYNRFFGWLLTPQSIDPVLEIDGRRRQLTGSLPDLMIDEALRFVDEKRSQPFALSIHFLAPHHPYGPVLPIDAEPYAQLDPTVPQAPGCDVDYLKRETLKYYASVHSIDRNVGRLLDGLDRLGLTDRTIVLFTSDHGYMIGHHGLQHKGNAHAIIGNVRGPRRPNMFDNSIRVPLLVRWPGVVPPATVIEETVSNIDLPATILGMLCINGTLDRRQQGLDFSPLLRGPRRPLRDALFGQYDLHNGGLAYLRMIRTEDWKLVRCYRSNMQDELYDLRRDREETRNLRYDPAQADVVRRLTERLETWMRSIDDPLLGDPGYDATRIPPQATQ